MKQQYAQNCDDPYTANERLKNKLDFLQRQSIKRQSYVKDLERNVKLYKQAIKGNQNSSSGSIKNQQLTKYYIRVQEENTALLAKLKNEYENICKLNTLYLMECQLRIEQSKNYNQRIIEFEENIQELRRYLHDKEESFSYVVEKLKKYEQIMTTEQLVLYEKLINYSGVVKEELTWKEVIKDLTDDRDEWKKIAEQRGEKIKKVQILVKGMTNYKQFQQFQSFINSLSSQKINKIHANFICNSDNNLLAQNFSTNRSPNQLKNPANLSTNISYSQNKKSVIQPNIQLIRLMKKQKLSNKILENALTQAIEKNIELQQANKLLINHNMNMKQQINWVIADMVVVCEMLAKYDENYSTKLRVMKHRSRDDMARQSYKAIIYRYRNNSLQQAKEILFIKARNDVQQLGEYINLCPLTKSNNIRSYQSPRKLRTYQNQSQKIQLKDNIQSSFMNDNNMQQYEITQI